MPSVQLTEDNIADYAATLVERVRGGGHALDYSEGSVAVLENLLRLSDDTLQSPDLLPAHRDITVFYNGCYLGEVMARNLSGVWRFEGAWSESSLVFATKTGGIQIYPFHKLFRRVTEGPAENDLVAYYTGLKARLSAA